MKFTYLRSSFSGGEVSPELNARFDLPAFLSSCSTLTNFIPLVFGSVTRTPGTKYLRATVDQGIKSRHYTFQASTQDKFELEFSENKISLFTEDGALTDNRQSINSDFNLGEGITGWTNNSVGAGFIIYDFINLRMSFSGAPGAEARAYKVVPNPSTSEYTVTLTVGAADIVWRAGSTIGGSEFGTGSLTASGDRTFNFTPTTNDCFLYVEFEAVAATSMDSVSITSPAYTMDHPYSKQALSELQFTQSNDVLYVVHKDYIPRRMVRRANNWWQFQLFDSSSTNYADDPSQLYTEGPYLSLNQSAITITPSSTTGSIQITASGNVFASTDIGRLIRWSMGPENEDSISYAGNATQTNFDITFDFPNGAIEIEVYIIGTLGAYTLKANPADYTIVGTQVVFGASPGAGATIRIQRAAAYTTDGSWGYGRITNYLSETQCQIVVLQDLPGVQPSTLWQLGAFSTTTGYPRAATFHGQRLILAGTISNPSEIYASAVANPLDFSPDGSTYTGIISSSNSFSVSAASNQLTSVEWLASRINLIVGTSSSIFELQEASGGLSATELPSVLKRNENGARPYLTGLPTGSVVLYTNRNGNRLLELNYDIQISSLEAIDMSILANHLFTSPIQRIVFQSEPNQVIWILTEDGDVLTCTYVREQELRAFARQDFGGIVDDMWIAIDDMYTSVYIMIRREVDGSTVRYVEKVQQRFSSEVLNDAWFLTSAIQYDQTQSTTLDIDGITGSVICTAGVSSFTSGDVGRIIYILSQNIAIRITSYIGLTSVRGDVLGSLTSLNIVSGDWKLSVTTLTGLTHLEGETVQVIADSNYIGEQVVSGGEIELPKFAYNVLVGLPMTSTLITNDFSIATATGVSAANLRNLYEVKLSLFQSYGGYVSSLGSSETQALLTDTIPNIMDGSKTPFTGWLSLPLNTSYGDEIKLKVEQTQPYPLTITGVILKCAMGDL